MKKKTVKKMRAMKKKNNSMPKFLEEKLKKEYGSNSSIPYKIMNSMGVMHGNKETEKGREMEKKHRMPVVPNIKKIKKI